MNTPRTYRTIVSCLATCAILALAASARPAAAETRPLIDFSAPGVAERLEASSSQTTYEKSTDPSSPGLTVRIAPGGDSYPGLTIKPSGATWDLSAFGHVEARLTNTGGKDLSLNLRVDNDGDWRKEPWNCESVYLKPGETATVKVLFGYQYGLKPGYKLDPSKVVRLLLFTGKVREPVSFRIDSVVAAGPRGEKPPVKPEDVRVRPVEGRILGRGVTIDAAKQIETPDGGRAELATLGDAPTVRLSCPADRNTHRLLLHPPIGRWDLTQASEVRVRVKNVGAAPVTPSVQLTTDRYHGTETIAADEALPPGRSRELVVPFAPTKFWQGTAPADEQHPRGEKGTGTSFLSDKVDAVVVTVAHEGEAALSVESITALAAPIATPDWLGRRPPVEGQWTMTFHDEFDGPTIDRDRWNIYTENYWDKRSHFSKDNVLLGGGMARLRMERKTGHENDDPKRKETDYAVGFLDTYGRWAQRYGYFEARMKLPTAPGLWPAFWMMPDRGPASNPQWKRADTGNGGMEFDIMEHLTRWGPYRYNIAMHWDGYQKGHKSAGTSQVYVQPDSEGFLTCGLLWTPGSAVYYCNGRIVARWDSPRVAQVPCYPILYMVTGGWDNNAVDDDQLPADFVIDYVRIWQRADLASEVDGPIQRPADAAGGKP